MIDKAFKVNVPGVKNPFQNKQKRKPQSQSALRGKSAHGKKSNLKIIQELSTRPLKNMQKSQISFKLESNIKVENNMVEGENSKTLHSAQPEILMNHRFASPKSSSSVEDGK